MRTFQWEDDRSESERELVWADDNDQLVDVEHSSGYTGDAVFNVPASMYHSMMASVQRVSAGGRDRYEFRLPADLLRQFSREATVAEFQQLLESMV